MSFRNTFLLVAVALVVCACASPRQQPPGYLDYNGMDAEFQAAKQDLRLPAGATWPAHATEVPETIYAKNYGMSEAQLYWLCAWEKEVVATFGQDAGRHGAALSQLRHLENTWLYQHGVEADLRQLMAERIEQAEEGDISLVRQDVEVNCAS